MRSPRPWTTAGSAASGGRITGAPVLGTAVTDVVRRHPVGLMQTVESVLRALPETEVVLGLASASTRTWRRTGWRARRSRRWSRPSTSCKEMRPSPRRSVGDRRLYPRRGPRRRPAGGRRDLERGAPVALPLLDAGGVWPGRSRPPARAPAPIRCQPSSQGTWAGRRRSISSASVDHVIVCELGHLVVPERRARSIELICDARSMASHRSVA